MTNSGDVDDAFTSDPVRLFLCGDVMLGRGIDQVLPHPGDPRLYEVAAGSALDYVRLAEAANGPIPRGVALDYVWGDALPELSRFRPHARIVNLETSVTKSAAYAPKGINYRMNPQNAGVLSAAGIDCCVLANNHVLDFGRAGLLETLDTLHGAALKTVGAGRNRAEAQAPAVVDLAGGRRLLVFAFGHSSSGIPANWAAQEDAPGVDFVADFSDRTVAGVEERIRSARCAGDIVVASIHWGTNWGYRIAEAERTFAHRLIDSGCAVVHGHSSHHPRPIEVYHERLVLYGCGDFLNDYEGIAGYEEFRGELSLMYLPQLSPEGGRLIALRLVPFRIARFQLHRAAAADVAWLQRRLDAVSRPFGTTIQIGEAGDLTVGWR